MSNEDVIRSGGGSSQERARRGDKESLCKECGRPINNNESDLCRKCKTEE